MKTNRPAPGLAAMRRHDRQNAMLVIVVGAGMIASLKLASVSIRTIGEAAAMPSPVALMGFALSALAFATIGALTLNGLMHEAFHDRLVGDRRRNDIFGTFVCWLFPGSFTILRRSHIGHHCFVRTDFEKFDLYDDDDNVWMKFAHWYGVVAFAYYAVGVPLVCFGFALWPSAFLKGPLATAKTTAPLFSSNFFTAGVIRRVRVEMLGCALLMSSLFLLLDLRLTAVAALYGLMWWNWSTRQHLGHAFAKRDVVDGGHNLKTTRLHRLLMLNINYELVHHQFPHARWQQLHGLRHQSAPAIGYAQQYLRLWRGPVRSDEPAPAPVLPIGDDPAQLPFFPEAL